MTTTKRGRGRPRTPASGHHTATIEISVTPELRRLVERASGHPRHGAITGWVTRAIEAALGRADAEREAYLAGYRAGVSATETSVRATCDQLRATATREDRATLPSEPERADE